MFIEQLCLANIRCFAALQLELGPGFNIFTGANGSGKTSILEAIHLLGLGKSFRATSLRAVMTHHSQQCWVRGKIVYGGDGDGSMQQVWLAMQKRWAGGGCYKVANKTVTSATALARWLPLQLINSHSLQLIEAGGQIRRQFLDWGMFHVEPQFLQQWRQMKRALEQRNAWLKRYGGVKRGAASAAWGEWESAFQTHALRVDAARKRYVEDFRPVFLALLQQMMGLKQVQLYYQQGWQEGVSLQAALSAASKLDRACGHTTKGPHRGDLVILIDDQPAKQVLSRGQIKLFVCIMLLARAQLLQQQKKTSLVGKGIFLLDDMRAELDRRACLLLLQVLDSLQCQVFITAIEYDAVLQRSMIGQGAPRFHVEPGRIERLKSSVRHERIRVP